VYSRSSPTTLISDTDYSAQVLGQIDILDNIPNSPYAIAISKEYSRALIINIDDTAFFRTLDLGNSDIYQVSVFERRKLMMISSNEQNFVKFYQLTEYPCSDPLAECGIDPTISTSCTVANSIADNGVCRCEFGFYQNGLLCDPCDGACTNGCSGGASTDCSVD
jgi:hypothetical protein